MQIDHHIVWYNGMGGSPVASFVGPYLLGASKERFGTSFNTIEMYAHVPSRHVDMKLPDLARRFDERTVALPKAWIKRKQRRIELAYNSKLGFAEELIENHRHRTPSVAGFQLACRETIGVIGQLR